MQTSIRNGYQFRRRINPPGFDILAGPGGAITALIRCDERRAQIAKALFRNPKAVVFAAGGMLPNIHAQSRHQLTWVLKSFDITDFRDHGQRKDMLDTFGARRGLDQRGDCASTSTC